MSATTTERRTSLLRLAGKWVAELLLVFIGAYAAFSLNTYQQHRQDAKRRDQILASLENYVQLIATQSQRNAEAAEKRAAEFERALAAGEMPPVKPIIWTTDYSPTDIGNFLQAGGLDLLEVKTLTAMRNADSVTRSGLSNALHDEKLSDELIVPNLSKGASFFYDPATKQLKEPFTAYPATLRSYAEFFHRMATAYGDLLNQIKAERAANR
jgi:phosphodiesterase/alkaline phosphatase D-like protein